MSFPDEKYPAIFSLKKKVILLEEKVDISFKQFLLLKGLHGPYILSGSWCLCRCVEGGVDCLLQQRFFSFCK